MSQSQAENSASDLVWGSALNMIPSQRQAEIKALANQQREWVKDQQHDVQQSAFHGVHLNGVEVFFLAAYALAGLDGDIEQEAARLRTVHETATPLDPMDLSTLFLEGAILRDIHLEGAMLKGAHLEDVRLQNAHLEGAILSNAHLEMTHLFRAHLERADLREAFLNQADLNWTFLDEADLSQADLEAADLRQAHLKRANLTGAQLAGADLRDADLRDANLKDTNLSGTIFDYSLDSPQLPARPRPYRIFLSSTSLDLQAHRLIVHDTIERLRQFPIDMAQFGARGDGDATRVSLAEVAGADVYILLVAWRYGYVPPHEERSVTHLEYLAARKHNLPIFVYLADPSTRDILEGPNALFPTTVRDPNHWQQLLDFRDEVGRSDRHVYETFTTPDDLARRLGPAISNYLLDRQLAKQAGHRSSVPRYLPPPPPGFVGRERELDDLCHRLRSGIRVGLSAAVTGMAGVGKSALAAQVLYRLANESPAPFPGGITWVACNERTGTTGLAWAYDQVLSAWGASLSREEVAEADSDTDPALKREQALQHRVAVRHQDNDEQRGADDNQRAPKLVFLDNVEEALPLARALALLSSAGITTLITARHRPMLPTLSLVALDTLEHESQTAVTLFAERYEQAGGSWDTMRDAPSAQQVAGLLGYLPLAIELEAARAVRDGLSVAALAADEKEADRFGQLSDPLNPTRSVRYVFERSMATLSDEERHCLIAIGMLAVPDAPRLLVWDLFSQLLVPSPDRRQTPLVEREEEVPLRHKNQEEHLGLACLSALAARSLISQVVESDVATQSIPVRSAFPYSQHESTQAGTEAGLGTTQVARRIRVHPLLHELARAEWSKTAADRRVADVIAFVDACIRYTVIVLQAGVGSAGRFAVLERDETLLVGAIHLAQQGLEQIKSADHGGLRGIAVDEHVAERETFASLVVRLVDALWEYTSLGGHWRQGMDLHLYQLRLRRELRDRGGEGTTLARLGYLSKSLDHLQEAFDYYQQALVIAREVSDRWAEATALNNLAAVVSRLGRKEEALGYYQQAFRILEEIGDEGAEATTLSNMGTVASSLGFRDEAHHYFEQALKKLGEASARGGKGRAFRPLDFHSQAYIGTQEAFDYYQQALVLVQEVGDRWAEGTTLNNLGAKLSELGRNEEAFDYYQQALASLRKVGDRGGEGTALQGLGDMMQNLGRKGEALAYYQQALAVIDGIGLPTESEELRANIAELLASVSGPENKRATNYARSRWR